MMIDRTYIRVKAMLIALHDDGQRHLVSVNEPSTENVLGFHRLIGGSVEVGETHRDAIIREIDEELGVDIVDLTYLGMIENIFTYNGELGHEIVALYSGRLDPAPGDHGGALTEDNGAVVPVEWRPCDDAEVAMPLYPTNTNDWIRELSGRTLQAEPRSV